MRTRRKQPTHTVPQSRSSLDLGELRILTWLEYYPFQRTQDLVVALSPWEGRGAVYRRLASLHARHLVERLAIASVPKEPLYHLSPAGRLAVVSGVSSTASQTGGFTSQAMRNEREQLVNMLPRVPVWMVMQDVVNGLVLYTARALARPGTGEQARVVRWNWIRDWSCAFSEQGKPTERRLRARADGALSICLSFSERGEEWYTLLLLYSPLDDGRLLHTRLDRLVRWREALEYEARRASASPLPGETKPRPPSVPPVLILAQTPRQAERWHLAVAGVAMQRQQDAPGGAIATLPEAWRAGHPGNTWRLPWRTLDTEAACHLQEVLSPSRGPDLPELALQEQNRRVLGTTQALAESTQVARLPSFHHQHLYALKSLSQEGTYGVIRFDERLASVSLPRRSWEILWLLLAHPLLSREELAVVLGLAEKSVQLLLTDLVQKALVIRAGTAAGARFSLADSGLRLVAHAALCRVSRFVRLPLEPGQPLEQRGVRGFLHQIHHTACIYAFFAGLIEQFSHAPHPGARLCWWETGAACTRVFTYRNETHHFVPDAAFAVQVGSRQMQWWLEWDRGTMGIEELESKCATYAAYVTSREWGRRGAPPPALMYIAPEIAQERRFVRAAEALLTHLKGLHVYTTTASLLTRLGVLDSIFHQVDPTVADTALMTQRMESGARRLALFVPKAEAL